MEYFDTPLAVSGKHAGPRAHLSPVSPYTLLFFSCRFTDVCCLLPAVDSELKSGSMFAASLIASAITFHIKRAGNLSMNGRRRGVCLILNRPDARVGRWQLARWAWPICAHTYRCIFIYRNVHVRGLWPAKKSNV